MTARDNKNRKNMKMTDVCQETPPAGLPEGEWVCGGVYRVEREIPYGKPFGSRVFGNPGEKAEGLEPWGARDVSVFFDLETTGLPGGDGAYAFLAGLGFCGESSFRVVQLFLADPGFEENWFSALEDELPDDFGFVTYNGIAFDLPLLRARYALARRMPSWNCAGHMDLLLLARHFYKDRLRSCSLSSVESNILGVRRGEADIPGSEIPGVYAGYLRTKDASLLRGVFYHNSLDIVSLAALQGKIGELVAMENCSGEDLVRCGDLWYIMRRAADAESAWRRALEYADGVLAASLRLADNCKRTGDLEGAKKYLEQALAHDEYPLETLESLARLEEHGFQNYGAALEYAERAIACLDSSRSLRDRKWSRRKRDAEQRAERLRKKIK